jgi:GTP pyrophosphokinase
MSQEELYRKQLEPYFQGEEAVVLEKLLDHATYLYRSLYRYSGESYLLRSLRLTCDKILKLNPDRATIMASVLISACYSPRCDLGKIEELFGLEVRDLVENLGKINSIKSRYSSSDSKVISNMFLTLAKDIRVIIIRLADRIENMETLEHKAVEKQKANAREILDVYVPIASRLGLYEYKLVLQDLAFKYVFPEEYKALKSEMEEYLGQTQKNIEDIKHELESLMFRNGFDVKISGRVKNLFSIYKKLKKKTATLDDIYDVFALRIVLNSDGNSHTDKPENIEILYKILSVLHSRYENMPERFKNYISNPKPNGYQSLHTTLIGLNSKNFTKPTEVQIRTAAMDRFSEHGYAAHWLYKQSHSLPQDDKFLKIWSDLRKNAGTIDSGTAVLKMNLYPDRVFALTPDNLVRELPLGATPIDFAFNVHSEIGHHCHLAKVNGQVVPLDYKLKNGDVVEIFTSQKVNTKLNWLEFAFTKQARNRIKSYFRALDKGSLFEQGEEELNLLLVKLGLEKLDENLSFLKNYKNKNIGQRKREEILEELGAGTITPSIVFRNCTGKSPDSYLLDRTVVGARFPKKGLLPKQVRSPEGVASRLLIGGEENMPYRISSCCKPKLTDKMIAYITKVKGVSVHKVGCAFVAKASSERLLQVSMEKNVESKTAKNGYYVSLLLEMKEKQGYLKNIVEYFTKQNMLISSFDLIGKKFDLQQRKLVLDVVNEDHLTGMIEQLKSIDGVEDVSRM